MQRKAIILMNDMRGAAENQVEIDMGFADRAAARAYIQSQTVEPYNDQPSTDFYGNTHGYSKGFAKGGPLEWMNRLSEREMQGDLTFGHGIIEVEEQLLPRWVRVS